MTDITEIDWENSYPNTTEIQLENKNLINNSVIIIVVLGTIIVSGFIYYEFKLKQLKEKTVL